jgi:hypothetical protein
LRAVDEAANLVNESAVKHLDHTLVDACIQDRAGRLKRVHTYLSWRGARVFGLPGAERLTGDRVDLERPNHTATIMRVQPRGGRRVDSGKTLIERLVSELIGLDLQLSPEGMIGSRARKQASQSGLQVERSSAHKQHMLPARFDLVDRLERPGAIVGDARGFRGVEDIDQMMRNPGALGHRGLCGADVQAAVQRHRVEGDHLRTEALGERDADGCFAGGGGAGEVHRAMERVVGTNL